MTFGEKLQELRKRGAMSQDVLAEKLEVSRQAISKWERDEAMPETEKIVRIANLFGVSTDYLLLDSEQATQKSAFGSAAPVQNIRVSLSSPEGRSYVNRIERLIRRHGYKCGFYYAGIGVFVNLICLLFRGFYRSAVAGMSGGITDFTNSNSFVSDFGSGDAMLDNFQNSAQQMSTTASSFGNLFLIGLIPGTALIVLGVFIIIKGKKIARETLNEIP